MSEWLGLRGARVLLAGAGGIGAALAGGFVAAGARVLLVDADPARLEEVAAEVELEGHGGATLAADLSTADACREAVAWALAEEAALDVLVHAVGINRRLPLEDYADEDWDRMVATNLSSAFWLTRAVMPGMRARGAGRMVFLSSVAGRLGHRHHGPYAATKGGIDQLVRVSAHELADCGVTVNAVAPGYVETGLTAAYLAEGDHRETLTRLVPAGRLGTPEDVVGPALFLASAQAGFVTGQVLYVDGGRTLV